MASRLTGFDAVGYLLVTPDGARERVVFMMTRREWQIAPEGESRNSRGGLKHETIFIIHTRVGERARTGNGWLSLNQY
jgi:hypothetical protein